MLYNQSKRPWSCIRVSKGAKICRSNFCLHNDLNLFPCILTCNMTLSRTMFDRLTLSRGRECVKEKHIGCHVIVCFISVGRKQNVGTQICFKAQDSSSSLFCMFSSRISYYVTVFLNLLQKLKKRRRFSKFWLPSLNFLGQNASRHKHAIKSKNMPYLLFYFIINIYITGLLI